jgi:hypothetical protein
MARPSSATRGATQHAAAPGHASAGPWRQSSPVERGCYLLAAVLVLSGVVHVAVLLATGGTWSGPLSMRKPATFGLSFGLTLATVTWVLSLLPRRRPVLLGLFGVACLVEVVVITVQAWRGLTSHFGVTGTGAGLVAGGAAGGAALILGTGAAAAVGAWQTPGASPSMRLALRVGFAELLVGLAFGVLMLARGQVLAAGGGPDTAFAFAAALKPAHGVALHGILVLPALAWLLSRRELPESVRLAVVRGASLGSFLVVTAAVVLGLSLG